MYALTESSVVTALGGAGGSSLVARQACDPDACLFAVISNASAVYWRKGLTHMLTHTSVLTCHYTVILNSEHICAAECLNTNTENRVHNLTSMPQCIQQKLDWSGAVLTASILSWSFGNLTDCRLYLRCSIKKKLKKKKWLISKHHLLRNRRKAITASTFPLL